MPATLAPPDVLLVRYGELALKKGNRAVFERALARNIVEALAPITNAQVERHFGRLLVIPARRTREAARRVQEVFGIKSVSPAWRTTRRPEDMAAIGKVLLDEHLAGRPDTGRITFRVAVRRADKGYPLTSVELEQALAPLVLPGPERIKVQLIDPELVLGVELRSEGTYVFLENLPGPGGLPVGTLGKVLCLLSGGIDSPVAAWLAMKRGCRVACISFHSYPFLGESSKKKVADLARALARFQGKTRLHVVPFADTQVAIRDHCPEAYRTVLYRRAMQRIASAVARREGYQALVTGECLGQVASQTLENMTCIGAASALPVLRPLVTYDKEETIDLARRIGTFELSIRPEPDCCTVFQPRRPIIKGRLRTCLAAEARIPLAELVNRAVAESELHLLDPTD
jgi:thiamine biosynthesis protein ThiI